MALNGGKDEEGDILSIMLTDDLYRHDMEKLIDECIAIFFAGT